MYPYGVYLMVKSKELLTGDPMKTIYIALLFIASLLFAQLALLQENNKQLTELKKIVEGLEIQLITAQEKFKNYSDLKGSSPLE